MKTRVTIVRQMPLQEQIQVECEIDTAKRQDWDSTVRPLLLEIDARHSEMAHRVAKVIAHARQLRGEDFHDARMLCQLVGGFQVPDPDIPTEEGDKSDG